MLAVWNLDGGQETKWDGYDLLGAAGQPRPAYDRLRQAFRPILIARLSDGISALRNRLAVHPARERRPVLAPDAVIHLGDGDFSAPWVPLYGARNPSTEWRGVAYVPNPRAGPWQLTLRLMQSNAPGNRVWINGLPLDGDFPPEDFSNSWVALTWRVPDGLLQPGANEVRIGLGEGQRPPDAGALNRDDLQFKDIVLWRGRR
jgi:hypothetical protein